MITLARNTNFDYTVNRVLNPTMPTVNIATTINTINNKIDTALHHSQRPLNSVGIIGASKSQPISVILDAFHAGITHFGENYWQEAKEKIHALNELPITWHFIGSIQSNKAAEIAKNFQWVHTVSSEKIAVLLNEHRASNPLPLQICIQINLDAEQSKSGILPDELISLANIILQLPKLSLRGLMIITKSESNPSKQYQTFMKLANLLQDCNQQLNCSMDTLSMGMSEDYIEAIKAGSTFIRLGRILFGERNR